MNRTIRRTLALCLPLACLLVLAPIARAEQWTAPTPEELKMTSQPEVPGAAAVYLFKEEITEDKLHMWSKYVRLKVLTEAGKEYANVELKQYSGSQGRGFTVGGIAGRTIHPDGTIIPFTGKPFDKLIEKGQGFKETAKVFTMPDVEVGSIIEYRYQLRYDDNYFIAPDWFVQSDLYTRKGHYVWKPTGETLITSDDKGGQLTSGIAWLPILPKGADFKQTRQPAVGYQGGDQFVVELNIHDVPPVPDEEYMPPIESLSYRVLFYYSPYRSQDEFWKNEGKRWAKNHDKFIGPDSKVRAAVKDLVADSDTPEQKLRKIYAAVMKLDNTSYTRERSAAEDKSQGLGEAKSTDDIWERKRGNDDEITELFVAMARAAGMKAYVMGVTNRDRSIFLAGYFSLSQLDDDIAIVNIDGKDQFFDPGQRYCPYGQLAWKHTIVQGLRQVDGGSAFGDTPGSPYKNQRVDRVADLTMDEHGEATGTVTMTFQGSPALRWRQSYLRGDETSLKHDLQTSVEKLLPGGMDVKVSSIQQLEDYEQPLIVKFDVKGQIASSTGKRLLLPGDIFEANAKPTFPHEKRDLAVYFEYTRAQLDAVRVKFPASLAVESVPAGQDLPYQKTAMYSLKSETTATSVTVRRNFLLGDMFFPKEEFPQLRAFYTKLETKDQEPVVLKVAAGAGGQ
jgi:Transglutaminase-like superfamily/Domain of Unknown Function with PDB structure (DUF3857)